MANYFETLLTRRETFRLGAAAATGNWFLPLVQPVNGKAASKVSPRGSARFAIFVMLDGGQSHVDAWDLKEHKWTPQDFEIREIQPGVKWPVALYPKLGRMMDKYALIRSAAAWDAVHGRAQYYIQAAHPLNLALKKELPPMGAVVAAEMASRRRESDSFPPYVAINVVGSQAGLLGSGFLPAAYSPFHLNTTTDLSAFSPDPEGKKELLRRWEMLKQFDDRLRTDTTLQAKAFHDYNDHYEGATKLMADPRAATVFKMSEEDRKRYGATGTGDACILARNLIEADAGTNFIFLQQNGWDHHKAIYEAKNHYDHSRELDSALAALLNDLHGTRRASGKSLLDETVVFCMGEFGRTPGPVNLMQGRDHYPNCYTVLAAGGGIKGGRILGKTDEMGEKIVDPQWAGKRPIYMEDIATTVYSALGIDWTKTVSNTPSGRTFYYVEPLSATSVIVNKEVGELFA